MPGKATVKKIKKGHQNLACPFFKKSGKAELEIYVKFNQLFA
jgi:hypothetical protein